MNTSRSIPVFQEEDFYSWNGRFWLGIKRVRSYLGLEHSHHLIAYHKQLIEPFVVYPDDIPQAKDEGFLLDLFGAYLFAVLADTARTPRFTQELGRFIIHSKANRNKAMALRYKLATLEQQIRKKQEQLASEQLRSKLARYDGLSKMQIRRMEELSQVLGKQELASLFGLPIQQITRLVNLLKQSEGRAA